MYDSTVAIQPGPGAPVYRFAGVTRVSHTFSLKIASDDASGADAADSARVQPDQLQLSVVETDTGRPAGWASRMAEVLEQIRRARLLCTVITARRVYERMLLRDLVLVEDETVPDGWTGTLTFVEAAGGGEAWDRSSEIRYVGLGSVGDSSDAAAFGQIFGSASDTVVNPAARDAVVSRALARAGLPEEQAAACTVLPQPAGPRSVCWLTRSPSGEALQAELEMRYLPGPDTWVVSLRDAAADALLVNQVPLRCSGPCLNDLFAPFAHLRQGRGVGSLYCLPAAEPPSTPDPSESNMGEFILVWL